MNLSPLSDWKMKLGSWEKRKHQTRNVTDAGIALQHADQGGHEAGHLKIAMDRKRKTGREKRRRSRREEDQRWQRLPWPGPRHLRPDRAQRCSWEPENQDLLEDTRPHSCNADANHQPEQREDQLRRKTFARCHPLVLLLAMLSLLIRPSVAGK